MADHKDAIVAESPHHSTGSTSHPLLVPKTLSPDDIKEQIEGYKWILSLAEASPDDYNKIYQGLPADAKNFIRFLRDKADAILHPVALKDPGNTTVVTMARSKGATDPIILVENGRGTVPSKKSLCSIFNELESEGFHLIKNGAAGARFGTRGEPSGDSELIFVFSKNPIYDAQRKAGHRHGHRQ